MDYLRHLVAFNGGSYQMIAGYVVFYGLCALLLDLLCWYKDEELPFGASWHPAVRGIVYGAMIVMLMLIGDYNAKPFIYFQF